jgi:hypothetical protein
VSERENKIIRQDDEVSDSAGRFTSAGNKLIIMKNTYQVLLESRSLTLS